MAEAEQGGEIRDMGIIANRPEAVRKLIAKLGPVDQVRACYEAGPTGYGLYWQLVKLGIECVVIAPTLIPTKRGERIKTDRRDAAKLARSHRAGELTASVGAGQGTRSATGFSAATGSSHQGSPPGQAAVWEISVTARMQQTGEDPLGR